MNTVNILHKARNAVERGIGWRKRGRRVATCYDKYAHRCMGFPHLAAAWIWMNSKFNATRQAIMQLMACYNMALTAQPTGTVPRCGRLRAPQKIAPHN